MVYCSLSKEILISNVEKKYLKNDLPNIKIGDLIRLKILIQEGNKERIQLSEGIVIAKHSAGLNTTITTRRIFQGIGIERVYLIHSPRIVSFEILKSSKVRQSKIYYLRNRVGKAARLKQKIK
uniref:Large ribosomal subunit protein bL19c n=1 Tax=Bulboplastis apyrenoidosa TaxID=1070855 RepID=A0A1Y9TMC9_9RHOD|nr:50S ribosomal protein L19 [Bulboplastis apyrenoidosa]ARO90804.1 50S ribosomal protein L19 [Bulboplastis apyrenoidosa]